MAGYQENPNLWRLQTNTGIPYKVKGMTGAYDPDVGSFAVQVIIHASSLNDFLEFIFPEPEQIGYVLVPRAISLPGLPEVVATSFTFKSLDDNMPIDPLGFDAGAPDNTYHKLLELDIKYDTRVKQKQPNPNEPRTFLEISAQASGEFLHTSMPGSKWITETAGGQEGPGDKVKSSNERTGDSEPVKDPTIPVLVMIPTTEYSIRYPQIDYEYYHDVFVHRLDAAMGKVNSDPVPWIHGGTEEGTLLFVGYSENERSTWRSGKINKPPVTVEMKMVRKRVVWTQYTDVGNITTVENVIAGHNHVWRPGKGWTLLTIGESSNETKLYRTWDMNRLFKQD